MVLFVVMGKKRWVIASLVPTLVMLVMVTAVPTAYGQSAVSPAPSQCSISDLPFYDARAETKPGNYNIFIKMGKRGQVAPTTLYIDNNTCQTIGSVSANGDAWQKIGSWASSSNKPVRFQLNSELFTALPDANRPSIMLVPLDNPPCQPSVNCDFTFQGQEAFISPISSMLSEDTLRVLQVVDPKNDALQHVDYYSDGQLLYTKPILSTFDLRYVSGGDHILSRVLQYKSGQKVVLQDPVSVSFEKDLQNLLFRKFNSYKIGIQIFAVIAVIALIGLSILEILRVFHRRRIWKLNHGIIHEEPVDPNNIVPVGYVPPPHFLSEESALTKVSRRITPLVIVAVASLIIIGLVDSYAYQLFRVDGRSMESTLQTDDQILVSKISKSWATLNQQEYVPNRGEVVVFHKAHSQLFLEENTSDANVYVVKRVLGLPGERVVVVDGKVTVYNNDQPKGFNPDAKASWATNLTLDSNENIDVTLGPSEIFVSGDNRPESLDSRSNGPISVREIVGRARARVLPLNKYRGL